MTNSKQATLARIDPRGEPDQIRLLVSLALDEEISHEEIATKLDVSIEEFRFMYSRLIAGANTRGQFKDPTGQIPITPPV